MTESPAILSLEQELFFYDAIDFSLSLVGLVSGIFCLYAVLSQRFYSKFLLVVVHTTALLLATLPQVLLWPALEYASHKNATCHGFKFFEYSARVLVNNSSAAMMFWYMLFNKSMYFYNYDKGAINLRKLTYESWIYFIGSTIIAEGTMILYFCQASGSIIFGRVNCFTVAFFEKESQDFLIEIVLYAPLYLPLGLGMIWFMLGRSKWKVEASEVIPGPHEDLIAVIHRLFYWLAWSAILTQVPVFCLNVIHPKSHDIKVMTSVFTHMSSIQNGIDAAAFYVILLKPTTIPKFGCLPESQISVSEIVTLTTTLDTQEGTNDLTESLLK